MTRARDTTWGRLTLLLALMAPSAVAQAPPELRIQDLTSARLEAVTTGKPIVLVFGSLWCSSCRSFKRDSLSDTAVRELGSEFHWAFVELDRNISLARRYAVDATPTLFIETPEGVLLGTAQGALTAEQLVRFLSEAQHLAQATDDPSHNREPLFFESMERRLLTYSPQGYRGHAICFSHVGYGPLRLPSQAPGQVLRLGMEPRTPSTLAKGEIEIGLTESLVNIFNYRENDFRLDYATLHSVLTFAYGLTDTVLVEFEYSDLSRFDSILDPITTAFHDGLGIGDAGRDLFPEGDNALFLAGAGGASDISNTTTGSIARDVGVTLQHNITCGTRYLPAISYAITARHYTGGKSGLTGSSPWSMGLSLSASRRFSEQFYAYAGVSYATHGMDRWNGIALRPNQTSGNIALEWRYGPTSSFVVQYLLSEGVAVDRDPFNENAHEIGLGWKHEIEQGTLLEIGLIENAVTADNSPDFGLHMGLRYRF